MKERRGEARWCVASEPCQLLGERQECGSFLVHFAPLARVGELAGDACECIDDREDSKGPVDACDLQGFFRERSRDALLGQNLELRRLAELEKRQRADTLQAEKVLRAVEENLRKGRWNSQSLDSLIFAAAQADKTTVPIPTRQRLHLAVGLCAYLADKLSPAAAEFSLAKRLGVENHRVVVAEAWTPGAVEAFIEASR